MNLLNTDTIIVTAGSSYLDIDAYACSVAMAELLALKGVKAVAYSEAPLNYSVASFLIKEGQLQNRLPFDCEKASFKYIIVDVSDVEHIKKDIPIENVVAVYDHHAGFEKYWKDRIGEASHIDFIGAAATLIYNEWKKEKLIEKMSRSTTLLLIAAILDNTLNLTSENTTPADTKAFSELVKKENIGEEWCAAYFAAVQENIEADLKNALLKDIKTVQNNKILPSKVAQLCVWDATKILKNLSTIRKWMSDAFPEWMINIIDIKQQVSFFVCNSRYHQKGLENLFGVNFEKGVAKMLVPHLRKEIIKKAI